MRLFALVVALCAQALAATTSSSLIDSTTVYIQAIGSSSNPVSPLAEIKYNPSTLAAEIASFDAPDLPTDSKLVRIGIYDVASSSWKSSTSTTSVDTFSKGYAPTLVVSLDAQGGVLGVTCKSGKVDAGQTRDFGPKVKLLKTGKGKQPILNTPVVLTADGKVEEPVPEKTLLQKYWWVLLGGLMLLMTTGGE